MLLQEIVLRGAQNHPNDVALIFRDQTTTFGEMAVAVQRLAAGLTALGIRPGERIALLLPNCTPFVYGYYGAALAGIVVVPANPLLKPAELEYIWRDADIRLVITAGPLLLGVQAARQNLPGLRGVVSITPREELPETVQADAISGFTTLQALMAQGAQALARNPAPDTLHPTPDDNDCAVIIYTSGTTGHPKGAMLSHRNLTRNVEQVQAAIQFSPADRFLTVLPLFHSFAATVCMNTALATGCASLLLENFVPGRVVETIEKHRATIFCGVPAMFNALLHFTPERAPDLSSLRLFVSGGAPLPAATLAALEQRYGLPVLEGDGPTECSPVTSVNPLEGPRKVGSVGPPLPGVEIAIFDDQDNLLPAGEIGEIVVRGDNVMLGYLNQPEATAEAMTRGWYHTGDLGYRDADGYVFIVDRKKDMIITSGLNVYPREVEEVLFTHPAVADAAVIGMPDALRGEEVVAVVVQKPDVAAADRDLIAFCRERLANFKVPRRVLFRDTLPRGGTGKVVKRLLKKELEMSE
jgi:long-chain acyl-CoA synthetase